MVKIEIDIPEYLINKADLMIKSGDFEDLSELTIIALSYFSGRYNKEQYTEDVKET